MVATGAKPAFEAYLNMTFPVRYYFAPDDANASVPLTPPLRPRETGGTSGPTGLPTEAQLLAAALDDLQVRQVE